MISSRQIKSVFGTAMRKVSLVLALLLLYPSANASAEMLESQIERGPVQVTLRLEPSDPVIGDSVHLEVEALAEDGVELLMPEFGEALDRFLILDFAPSEGIVPDGRHRATQRYTLQPPRSGPQSIPPLLIEFVDRRPGSKPAPAGADAYEILTERMDFEVESVLPEGALNELNAMPGQLAPLGFRSKWPFIAAAVVLAALLLAGPFLFRAWQRREAVRRRKSAYQIATVELRSLLESGDHPIGEKIGKFYVELTRIIRGYLEDRFNLRSPELTTEEFLIVASRSPDLSAELRSLLSHFLGRADLVKFAGLEPGQSEIDESVEAARRFLEETRVSVASAEQPLGEGYSQ